MASDVSVPNSFTNGTTADAPEVNANFAALVSWINTNTMQIDGSKAFTGVPSGPATDPTTANQLTRKAYVDAKTWGTANITDSSITAAKLASDAVTTVKILDANVTAAKLASDSVTTAKILDANVTAAKLATDSVETAKIVALAVTAAKIANNTITNTQMSDAHYTNIKNTKLADYVGRAKASGSQSIPNTTETKIQFGTEDYDHGAMFTVASNDRVTIPAAGVYEFTANVPFNANNTGGRILMILRFNSGGVLQDYVAQTAQDAGDSSSGIYLSCTGQATFAATDYVEVRVYQDSGGALSTTYLGYYANVSWKCLRLS